MTHVSRLAIFDLDGTLIEFHHDFLFSETRRVLEKLKLAPEPDDTLRERFSQFDYFSFVPLVERSQFVERFWSMFDWTGFPSPRVIPGASEALAALRRSGTTIAIATSRFVPTEILRRELAPTGLLEYVQFIASRDGDHIHWTDKTALIRRVLESFHAEPTESIFVGDIPTDIISAKQVGIQRTVAVRTGGIQQRLLEQAGPRIILNSVAELAEFLGLTV